MQHGSPAVLFGSGEAALLGQPGLAVVGSRDVDERGRVCARFVGNACGMEGLVLYSGGARGVDQLATDAALESRGQAVGVLAHRLERVIRDRVTRKYLMARDLALVTPCSPDAGFSVGAAMGRNRLIYALADYGLVVASAAGSGGTWAGATRALKDRWAPVFVLMGPDVPEGNKRLVELGAVPFPVSLLDAELELRDWLETHRHPQSPEMVQAKLFG
jgi:predicted Rossmann fold nucleotide-binding protein DprA/Smf involved in DNA uptake